MQYAECRQKESQFISLTSLYVAEFEFLLSHFTSFWDTYYRYRTLEGRYRKVLSHREHGNAQLKGTDQKLFFLLVYLKSNSLQEHQAASFGLSQSKVSRMAPVLLTVLNQTLTSLGLAPTRDAESLHKTLAAHFNHVFTYDGLERGIERNSDPLAQEEEYSGKKKSSLEKQFAL